MAESWSAGQEVQILSSIPLNWNPGSSEVGTSERSVHMCEIVHTYNMHLCVYHGE